MIFQFMEKYRMPILVALLLGLAGFGVWTFVLDAVGGGPADADDPEEVVATYELGGERHEVSRIAYRRKLATVPNTPEDDDTDRVAAAVSQDILETLADVSGITVSDDELKAVLVRQIREPLEQRDGRYERAAYVDFVNRRYRMTPEDFEAALREDLRLTKLVNEIERVNALVPMERIYDVYQKAFTKVKLGGVFFRTADFEEAARLEKDADGNLTPEGEEALVAWWRELPDDRKRAFNTTGALIDADVVGFRFAGKTDEELQAAFERESAISGTSLQKLTESFVPDEDVLAKLKLRLDRNRAVYGVDAETALDEAFEARKDRLVTEWKILKLLDGVHDEVRAELAKEDGDLKKLADRNNLEFYAYRNTPVQRLREGDEYPGAFTMQLPALENDQLLDWSPPLGPDTSHFLAGPVDEPGKHASAWVVRGKDLNPMPTLIDVHDQAVTAYEEARAVELRDEAFEAFEKKMDDWLEAKVADAAAAIREDARKAIEERTAGLDPVADAERIAEIEKEENEKADLLVDEEKAPFRSEAFKAVMADSGGIVVEEGYFLPTTARTERAVDVANATSEEMARSALRKEFPSLQDDAFNDRTVEIGTLGAVVESRTYPGLKGRAILLDKKAPTVEDMLLHPEQMAMVETSYLPRLAGRKGEKKSMWSWDHLRREGAFGLTAEPLLEEIEEERARQRRIDEEIEAGRRAREAAAE